MHKYFILAALVFSACSKKEEHAPSWKDTIRPISSSTDSVESTIKPGKFVFLQLGNMRRDQFLVDTVFGRVWNKVCVGKLSKDGVDCSETALVEINRIDSKGIFSPPPTKKELNSFDPKAYLEEK